MFLNELVGYLNRYTVRLASYFSSRVEIGRPLDDSLFDFESAITSDQPLDECVVGQNGRVDN